MPFYFESEGSERVGFFDDDAVPTPILDGYCPVATCGPSSLCTACILATQPCDLCDATATVVDLGLPLCRSCKATCDAEGAAPRWGSWRSALVWFQGTKFINVGTDVTRVRFAVEGAVR